MAIRSWLVRPDREILTDLGVLAVVSREALVEGILDAVSLIDRAGGGFTVYASRAATGVPNEMVTTAVMVEWRDRTDAKAQPERPSEYAPATYPDGTTDETTEALDVIADAAAARRPPDGFDESALEEEDLSEVPEGAR
jgi:hypothetical protein